MATLKELRDERLRKLEELKQLGVNPYPAAGDRTIIWQQITQRFESCKAKTVTVVGRILNIRKFGKIAFIVIKDDELASCSYSWRQAKSTPLDAANSELGLDQTATAGQLVTLWRRLVRSSRRRPVKYRSRSHQLTPADKVTPSNADQARWLHQQRRALPPPLRRHERQRRRPPAVHPPQQVLAGDPRFSRTSTALLRSISRCWSTPPAGQMPTHS